MQNNFTPLPLSSGLFDRGKKKETIILNFSVCCSPERDETSQIRVVCPIFLIQTRTLSVSLSLSPIFDADTCPQAEPEGESPNLHPYKPSPSRVLSTIEAPAILFLGTFSNVGDKHAYIHTPTSPTLEEEVDTTLNSYPAPQPSLSSFFISISIHFQIPGARSVGLGLLSIRIYTR